MKDILLKIQNGGTLSQAEACQILLEIKDGKVDPIQLGALLAMLDQRGATVEEILGFREGLLQTCVTVDLSAYDPVDIVGTGGDGKNTFNIFHLFLFCSRRSRFSCCQTRKFRCDFGKWCKQCHKRTRSKILFRPRTTHKINRRIGSGVSSCAIVSPGNEKRGSCKESSANSNGFQPSRSAYQSHKTQAPTARSGKLVADAPL